LAQLSPLNQLESVVLVNAVPANAARVATTRAHAARILPAAFIMMFLPKDIHSWPTHTKGVGVRSGMKKKSDVK
jgi:hypothetical protein